MNFLQWLKENGSINQSMPELENDEIPNGKLVTTEPYSKVDRSSILNKKFMIKAKSSCDSKIKEKIMLNPGEWIIKKVGENTIKAKNLNNGSEAVFPIDCIEIY
jgi:hypothetical protein